MVDLNSFEELGRALDRSESTPAPWGKGHTWEDREQAIRSEEWVLHEKIRRTLSGVRTNLHESLLYIRALKFAGHIIRRRDGGTDDPSNLRAECKTHNFADGARASNEQRQTTTPHHRAKGW